jgi:protein-S-isoprenylcysteine O-methyltransferase Ste14
VIVPVPEKERTWKLVIQALPRLAVFAIPFLCAGRVDWPRGWLFTALSVLTIVVTLALIRWKNPGLLRARLQKSEGTKQFDKVLLVIIGLLGIVGCLAVAGLDTRFGWSSIATRWVYLGVLLHAIGTVPIGLAVETNPFLETTVRIQDDRGHVAVTSGPYRIVRHPMYAGLLVMTAGWPLVFGSAWSYLPIAVLAAALVVRTALEDRTLQRELAGYAEYARRTRYRLLPGVW